MRCVRRAPPTTDSGLPKSAAGSSRCLGIGRCGRLLQPVLVRAVGQSAPPCRACPRLGSTTSHVARRRDNKWSERCRKRPSGGAPSPSRRGRRDGRADGDLRSWSACRCAPGRVPKSRPARPSEVHGPARRWDAHRPAQIATKGLAKQAARDPVIWAELAFYMQSGAVSSLLPVRVVALQVLARATHRTTLRRCRVAPFEATARALVQ